MREWQRSRQNKREILFRGQTRRKGEKVRMGDRKPLESHWVYGGIFPNNKGGDFAIIYQQEPEVRTFPVYADTVGEYIGKTDKNGKKIFEGDILAGSQYPYLNDGKQNYFAEVVWFEDAAAFGIITRINPKAAVRGISDGVTDYLENFNPENWEIVGNIFDNRELITKI